ncbi:hypothetical protein EU528_05210 [Candidatus Thorarchaeota archaeon]|nr:MAG: hypothetical protein EU528_05210 [Candidatus Thorarchaeota archaeon]
MSSLKDQRGILQELEKLESVLSGTFKKLSVINDHLRPLEHSLRAQEFSSSGSYVRGMSNGIVCILSALIKGDPLAISIESIKGTGRKFPAIIKGSDRSETNSTCESILKIVEGKPGGIPINYVINLRWANLPPVIDGRNVLIVGTRYYHGRKDALKKLYNQLQEIGCQILEDRGEFGGGLLTFKMTELAKKIGNITVLEITLSRHLAQDHERVADILESLTIL